MGPDKAAYAGFLLQERGCAKNNGMKFVSGFLTLIVLLAALSFALHNSQSTTVSLWPLGIEILAPLYILTIGTLFIGLLLGAIFGWIIHLPHRLETRRLKRDIANLKEKMEDMHVSAPLGNTGRTLVARIGTKRRFWERRS
jgi:uncharacterized integral membrane protein